MRTILRNTCLLSIITLLLAAPACKKTATTVNCKVTQVQNTGSQTTLTTYDNQGRVATYGALSSGNTFSFTYSGLTAGSTLQSYDTSYHITGNISLDASGRMVFMSKSKVNSGTTWNYTYTLQYDAEGHVILCDQTSQEVGVSGTTYTRDSLIYINGNLIDKYTFQKLNAGPYLPVEHVKMEYGTDMNKIGHYMWYGYEPPMSASSEYLVYSHLLGNTSKNLPVYTRYYDNTETLYIQISYSFLLNENGYPIEENMVRSINSPEAKNRKFEYSCD